MNWKDMRAFFLNYFFKLFFTPPGGAEPAAAASFPPLMDPGLKPARLIFKD